jgi:hypothetical protein
VATVFVQGKGVVAMPDLQVGDKVLAANNRFETVFTFFHMHRTKPTVFLQIYTESSKIPLEITGKHMVFLQGKAAPVPALRVKVGDEIAGANGPRVVTKIASIVRNGFYAPDTTGGTIMVDGILASVYISIHDTEYVELFGFKTVSYHAFYHFGDSPFRKFCMGVSMDLCNKYIDEEGHSFSAHVGKVVDAFCKGKHILVQGAAYGFVALLCAIVNILGSSALATILGGYVVLKLMKRKHNYPTKSFDTVRNS